MCVYLNFFLINCTNFSFKINENDTNFWDALALVIPILSVLILFSLGEK